MVNGVSLRKGIGLSNPQKLWDIGVRFVYAEANDNSMLRNVRGACDWYGFKFGVWSRLRYPPESGSPKTQVYEVYQALQGVKRDLPTVLALELPLDGTPIPPSNVYVDNANVWLQDILSYLKGEDLMVKVDEKVTGGFTPSGKMTTLPVWLKQRAGVQVVSAKFPCYTLRSYSERDVYGTKAEWVDYPGANWDGFKVNGFAVSMPTISNVVVPEDKLIPPTVPSTIDEKLDKIIALLERMQ